LANPQQQYLKTQIETASQPQLLVMIFDAAVKKLHLSKKAIAQKNIEKAHTELTKVQKIFTELMVALDFEKGGEIATNLLRIYDFVYHHLVKANIKQDSAMIDEVIPIVENLREGWTLAVEKFLSEQEGEIQQKPIERRVSFDSKQPVKPLTPIRRMTTPPADSPTTEEQPRPRLNIRG
jgi:flagellar protein FliS